ncbi:uncharacterized protein EV154DRAFT_554633 [Mucor mucedo]|uniref:uncharacterized protein n=1 Tax=Mucor mucedo TaxID=29922 RepID=UPI00221E5B4B|nr:uncharacterized protein EV154DRAFT_554633 [Mucor mucedo]KAI7886890.1 hypothetical protein EV154DRAFT_554633 [Mucor mucedo]
MKRLNSSIKASGQKLYTLNKMLHSQSISVKPKSRLVVSNELRERLKKDIVLVQGIDPGIVTTASINCVKAGTLFESINRFYMLENEVSDIQHSQVCDYSYVHTASKVNAAALATNHRIKREKRQKEGKTEKPISLERKRVTRKIRTKRYHKKNCSRYRSGMFKSHVLDVREGSVLTFVGDWSRNGTYIRGHERRSLDPVLKRLKCVEKDETFIVDEYKSTVNCSSCFEPTTKQIIRVSLVEKLPAHQSGDVAVFGCSRQLNLADVPQTCIPHHFQTPVSAMCWHSPYQEDNKFTQIKGGIEKPHLLLLAVKLEQKLLNKLKKEINNRVMKYTFLKKQT